MNNKEKVVELFIGLPCSGKSTHLNETYKEEDVYVISMDNIKYEYAKKMNWGYDEFFERPSKEQIDANAKHERYGKLTEKNNWEHVENANAAMQKDFASMVRRSHNALDEGKRVIVDLTNLTRKDRASVKKWYNNRDDVNFAATVFEFEENMDLIKSQNRIRGKKENKFIPDYVIPMMAKRFEAVEFDEGINEIKFIDGLAKLKLEQEKLKEEKPMKKRTTRNRMR